MSEHLVSITCNWDVNGLLEDGVDVMWNGMQVINENCQAREQGKQCKVCGGIVLKGCSIHSAKEADEETSGEQSVEVKALIKVLGKVDKVAQLLRSGIGHGRLDKSMGGDLFSIWELWNSFGKILPQLPWQFFNQRVVPICLLPNQLHSNRLDRVFSSTISCFCRFH